MPPASLKGQLLIAAPLLLDPNFRRTVVLVLDHGGEGALGVILNRPTRIDAGEAVPELAPLLGDGDPVHAGGPVQPQAVIALAEYAGQAPEERAVCGPIGSLDTDADPDDPDRRVVRVRVFAGYSGWSSGQLEGEMDEEAWFTEPALPGDVFSETSERLWGSVLDRKGGHFRLLARMPEDPSLN